MSAETCTCATRDPKLCRRHRAHYDPMAYYDGTAGDLVPGYADSADGQADAADQARADKAGTA